MKEVSDYDWLPERSSGLLTQILLDMLRTHPELLEPFMPPKEEYAWPPGFAQ